MNSLFVETNDSVVATVTNELYPKLGLGNDNDIPPVAPIPRPVPPRIERMNDLLILISTALNKSTSRRKKMKLNCVSFSNEVTVQQITHINDMKKKEKINIWYTKDEFIRRYFEIYHVIEYMNAIHDKRFNTNDDKQNKEEKRESNNDKQKEEEKNIDDNDDDEEKDVNDDDDDDDDDETGVCTRGLERHTKLGKNIYRMKKNDAIMSVLKEQNFQRSIGINEPNRLARVNNLNSFNSQNLAYLIALKDYMVAYKNENNNQARE